MKHAFINARLSVQAASYPALTGRLQPTFLARPAAWLFLLGVLLAGALGTTAAWGQKAAKIHTPEPIDLRYATLAARNPRPNMEWAALNPALGTKRETKASPSTVAQLHPIYLTPRDEKVVANAIRPPANSSDQTRAELEYLNAIQVYRSPAQVTHSLQIAEAVYSPTLLNPTDAGYEKNLRNLFYIGEPLGAQFTAANFPAIRKLLQNAMLDMHVTELQMKERFDRPRPYELESSLQPMQRMDSPSFPCSNTLCAFTQAYLLSEIVPAMRPTFLERANEVRWSRELLGVQYPSDDEGARVIAGQLLQRWQRNPQFRQDLQAAQAEWKASNQMKGKPESKVN